ncbi:leucine-rich repeat domain-containing protein [bacterium]|nr:leucine-rich repeat domain-containing protein [bacterium]
MFKKWLLVIALTTIIINISCRRNPTASENTAPTASFSINPTSGTTETTFSFDASSSSDIEDETDVLQVRWDWENDGEWDTDYRTIKSIIHKFSEPGTYIVVLEVKDTEALTNIDVDTVNVITANTVPTASFTVDPTSGTTETTFTFDASGSNDNEDETDVLQVKWDWENDGTFDTNYSTTKTATHQFNSEGTYPVKLEVKDSAGLTNADTISVIVSIANTAPTASFTVSPTLGTTATTFTFDASGSSDNEDATSVLQVRWDWENDGTYDTNYSTTKTATHQYSAVGIYTAKLEVKDSGGLTDTTVVIVTVENTAPTASFTINPTLGTITTTFNFNASGSSDNEDATSVLQVRWDWENDGTYDTNYSTTKTATHQYSAVGIYTAKLEVKDPGGLTNTAVMTVNVENTAPTASFTINPTSGTPTTTFTFDASSSSDNEDATSVLQVRWDWENDGTYDTNYSTTKTATHQYTSTGTYTVKLEVKDSDEWVNSTTKIVSVQESGNVVTIPDANFKALIRVALSKPSGDITELDMGTITSLNGSGWNISDISGIEYCTNLQSLNLEHNQIIDISDLSSLTNLGWLDLNNNQITNIYPLIQNSGIASGDIIYLNDNPLSTTSINTYIPQLEARGVTIYYDGGTGTVITLSDSNFEALIRTTLGKPTGNITDADMETIITLNGSGWNIADISGIEYCTNLQTLNLEHNNVVDLSDLSGLTNLHWIDLDNNQIASILPLVNNSGIASGDIVYLNDNPLNTTSINTYIPQLEARGVTVYSNTATVVTFSDSNFEALIRSTLGKPTGNITDSDMETITAIVGSGWIISDISGIEYCTNLQSLNLENNNIVDISDLSGLTNIGWLDLSDNQITNILPLVNNSGIASGDIVYLNDNPLSTTSINTYIPQLEARGVTVNYDGSTVVTIPDANFRAVIRETLGKPTGDITQLDMESIIALDGNSRSISDISGIEYCTNLQTLNLEDNNIVDISDLAGLTDLNFIDLSHNQISDIEPLVNNSGIASGDIIYLTTNPLSTTSTNTYIPQLQTRGVTVYN